jgi:hypothetical protein
VLALTDRSSRDAVTGARRGWHVLPLDVALQGAQVLPLD